MHTVPNTSEEYIAKIPALQLLMALGWRYLPPAECLQKRGSTQEELFAAVAKALSMVTADDAQGWFESCGYIKYQS